jgi:TonB family protein
MGSLTTEIPGSTAGTKSKRGGADTLENEAIGLDISVRIHGSQVTAVVLDTTEHVEPFEEDTSTMIVFPRGAVVKLKARVRTGHAVVLTNLATKQTALCKIIQVNSTTNAAHYVKLEFNQLEPGFWGVHFPSDEHSKVPSLVHEEQASTTATVLNATPAAPLNGPLPKAASRESFEVKTQPLPATVFPRTEAKPLVQETAKEPPKPAPLPVNYGATADVQMNNEVVPLAAAPAKRTPAAPKIQPPAAPQQIYPNSSAEAPIFDSLSTGDEIFGKETAPVTIQEPSLAKADARAVQAFGRSLDPSSMLQSVEMPKRHTGLKIVLSAAALVVIGAGAAFYVRQYRGNTRQTVAVSAPHPSTRQTAAAPQSTTTVEDTTTASQTPIEPATASTPETTPKAPQATIRATKEQNPITVTPVHSVSRSAASQNHPTISTGLANIYAGDLTARPEATQQHSSAPLQAPVPSISTGPGNLGGASPNAGLGSLVSGSTTENSALPKPVEPKPMVRGGVVSAPKLIRKVQPIYPSLATTNRVEGDVQVEALIDPTGKVTSTKAISGPMLLRRAAMDAVQQWRYSPALLDGKPISVQYKVTVSFRLGQ